jgi:hypothetical protein
MYKSTISCPRHYLMSNQLNASPLSPQEKSPRYPLERKLGRPQSRSARYGEAKIVTTWTRTRSSDIYYGLNLTVTVIFIFYRHAQIHTLFYSFRGFIDYLHKTTVLQSGEGNSICLRFLLLQHPYPRLMETLRN